VSSIPLPLSAAGSVRRSSQSSDSGPTWSRPWHLSNHTGEKGKLYRYTAHGIIRPESNLPLTRETSSTRKGINAYCTRESLGRVAAAEEVARRLGLPERVCQLAPAALQTKEFGRSIRLIESGTSARKYALTGTAKSTAPITFLCSSAGLFSCSEEQKR
jgi:hypothetical protein